MSNHSPSPWINSDDVNIISANGWHVCEVTPWDILGSRSDSVAIADAKLIVSAPDLYDMVYALTVGGWSVTPITTPGWNTKIWRWRDNEGNKYDALGSHDDIPVWTDEARDALAKQRGK